jgi:ABC-type dipeptide/oligopeptide/nickel transport system permease subunit
VPEENAAGHPGAGPICQDAIIPRNSLGHILAEGVYMREAPWITLMPIAVTVLGLNLAGDGLGDVLDPRMRGEA